MNAPLLWDNVPSWTPELRAKIPGKMALLAAEMQKGGWWTIKDVARLLRCADTAASARIRQLRHPKYGGFILARKLVGPNVFAWKIL